MTKLFANLQKMPRDFGLEEKFKHCQTEFDKLTVNYRNRVLIKSALKQEQIDEINPEEYL